MKVLTESGLSERYRQPAANGFAAGQLSHFSAACSGQGDDAVEAGVFAGDEMFSSSTTTAPLS